MMRRAACVGVIVWLSACSPATESQDIMRTCVQEWDKRRPGTPDEIRDDFIRLCTQGERERRRAT